MILDLDDEDFSSVKVKYRGEIHTAAVEVEYVEKDVYAKNKDGVNLIRLPRYECSFKIKGVII